MNWYRKHLNKKSGYDFEGSPSHELESINDQKGINQRKLNEEQLEIDPRLKQAYVNALSKPEEQRTPYEKLLIEKLQEQRLI